MVAKGVLKLALPELYKLIAKNQSLREATIISAEVYVKYRIFGGYHASLVLELRRSGSETLYLQLDGRSPLVSESLLSVSKESLVSKCTMKNRQTFSSVLTLGELQHLLRGISYRTAIYRVHPMAYDRFFVLLLQHYLEEVGNGIFVECKMKCSIPHRNQIREALRLHHGIPAPFSMVELLRSLRRCRENYPRLTQSSVSKALGLATAWNPSTGYDTARGQARAHKLAINIQSITKQLDHSVHAAEIRLLWEQSVELLRKLHERDPPKYDADFSCTLYCLGTHLHRTDPRHWEKAENLLREASRLYRKRYDDDSASEDNCIHLALTLQEHAESLEKLGQNESAQRILPEALGLLRRLFHHRRVGMRFPAVMRDYGDFIFADGGTRFRLGQGLHHPAGVANICSSRGCLLCTKYAERGA